MPYTWCGTLSLKHPIRKKALLLANSKSFDALMIGTVIHTVQHRYHTRLIPNTAVQYHAANDMSSTFLYRIYVYVCGCGVNVCAVCGVDVYSIQLFLPHDCLLICVYGIQCASF